MLNRWNFLDNLLIILITLVLLTIFLLVRRKLTKKIDYNSIDDLLWLKVENKLLLQTDIKRVVADLPALKKDDNCYVLAQIRCFQAFNYFENTGELTTKFHKSLWSTDQFKAMQELGLTVIRENIARGYKPEDVINKWFESEKHKQNILGYYKYTGISAQQFNGVWYYSQIFAR